MTNLFKTRSFYLYLFIIFSNSFVDLGHKILMQDTLFNTTSGAEYITLSAIVNALILLPYIFLFTPSGFISDKFSKVKVLRVTAAVAIPLTLFILVCYYFGFFNFIM